MRTLDELKKCATAAELCLIDAVAEALRADLTEAMRRRAIAFMESNPLPARDQLRFGPDCMREWMDRFRDCLSAGRVMT